MKITSMSISYSISATLQFSLILLIVQVPLATRANDWSQSCTSNCTCKWTNGKKSAICSSLQLATIPATLSTELQVLVLNDNHITNLNQAVFITLGLMNLQRIYLKKSDVQYVHRETFKDLKILVEVDLSDNKIEMLDKGTFMGNDRLRILYLNGNPLKRLVAYQFPVLPHLRTLDLHNCLISDIDAMALANLNLLEFLYLKNNLLESLNEYVFQHMINLKTLVLDENPWQCNCKLRNFRNWYVNSKVNSISLLCKGPPQHKDKSWDQVDEIYFGCGPKVELFNNDDIQNIEIGSNTTFSCFAYGDPLPDVSWELNGKTIDTENVIFEVESIAADRIWNNLTVLNMTSLDAGVYMCTATNIVGLSSQNISIYLTEIVQHVLIKTPETFWYFGLIMGTFGTIFFLILTAFIVCFCKRSSRPRQLHNKSGMKTSVSFNDQEKRLLDLSITTTNNDRVEGCMVEGNHNTAVPCKNDAVMSFEPIEIHSVENHRASMHGLHGILNSDSHHQLQPSYHQMVHPVNRQQQLIAVADGSCSIVGIPTSMATASSNTAVGSHSNQIAEEIPLNVSVFPPPPEFCSNIVSNAAYGNIFISVSVTQDMLDGATDVNMYPDLLNIPKRTTDTTTNVSQQQQQQQGEQQSQTQAQKQATNIKENGIKLVENQTPTITQNISSFATLPRNSQRRSILKKEFSFQHPHHQQRIQETNLYPHEEIASYHNLENTFSLGYADSHNSDEFNQASIANIPPMNSSNHYPNNSAIDKGCAACSSNTNINKATECPSCSSPPLDAAHQSKHSYKNPLTHTNPKYDNMGRRITASGNSTLSLPDEERLETEALLKVNKLLNQGGETSCRDKLPTVNTSSNSNQSTAAQSLSESKGLVSEFVSL